MTPLLVFVLLLLAQQSPSPSGSFDQSNSGSQPPFKSVGVRGTIDAGGYAASAGAKTQNDFFEQLTDLQVAVLRSAWAPKEPCEPLNSPRQAAIGLLARGEFGAAVRELETLSRTDTHPATRQLLGLAYEGAGQCAAAAAQFGSAAQSPGPLNEVDANLFAQSVALLLEGNVDQAEAISRRALERNPGPASLHRLSLGAALFQRGDLDNALRLFRDAANARTSDRFPFEFIAIAVRSAAAPPLTRTVDLLKQSILQAPNNAAAHYALACALSARAGGTPNSSEAAAIETELKRAVALDPRFADAHFRLGAVYAAREELAPAIEEYRSALDCDPRLIEAHYRLSHLYARSNNTPMATEQLRLHQQLRARQKSQIESGRIPVRLPGINITTCP